MRDLAAGSHFAGHSIDAVIGRGGMGLVYRATDLALDRVVALKIVAPELAGDDAFRNRFKRESKVAASIRHPHVIPVYHAGEEDGRLYITMQYVAGIDLKELIARDGRVPVPLAAELVIQIGDGLDAAHARGLVHRDVKPANILIEQTADGPHAYLTDFGLTKVVGSQSGPTDAGGIVGTLDFIAPEQIRGDTVDARADVYALGGVLFAAVTGQMPYPRDSDPAKLFAHISEEPPSIARVAPDLPAALDPIVRRAMAKDPEDRYPSAGDLGAAVSRITGGSTVVRRAERSVATGDAAPHATPLATPQPTPLSTPHPTGRRGGRALVLVLIGIAAVVAASAGLLLASGGGDDDRSPASEQEFNPAGTVVGRPVRVASPGDLTWDIRAGDGYAFVGKHPPGSPTGPDSVARVDARTMQVTDPFYSESAADEQVPSQRLEVSGGVLWVDTGLDHLTKIDVKTGAATDVKMPTASPSRRLLVDDGAVWLLDVDKHRVVTLDAETGALKWKPVVLPAKPNLHWDVGGGYAYVAMPKGKVLAVCCGRYTKTVLDSDPATAITHENGTVYTANSRTAFQRYDVRTNTLGTPLRIPQGAAQALAFRGDDIWAIYPVDRLLRRFDATTGKEVGMPIKLPRAPADIAASADGIWVLNQDGTVSKIKP